MKRLPILPTLFLFLCSPVAHAEVQLSLQDCVSVSIQRNLGILVGRNDVLESREKEKDAELDFLPRLSVDLRRANMGDRGLGEAGDWSDVQQAWQQYQQTGEAGDLTTEAFDYLSRELFAASSDDPDYVDYVASVMGTWQVYTAGRLTGMLRKERLTTEMNKMALTSTALQLVYDVTQTYCTALAASKNLFITQGAVKEAERYLKQFQTSQALGAATHVDILNAEALMQQERARSVAAQGAWDSSLMALKVLLGLPPEQQITLIDPLVVPEKDEDLDLDIEKLIQEAQEKRPELVQNSLSVEGARTAIDLIRSARRPNLSVGASYSESWNDAFGGDFVGSLWNVSAVLTMGLWGDSSVKSQVDEGQRRMGEDKEQDAQNAQSVSFSFFDGSSMRSSLFQAENAFEEAVQAEQDYRKALAAEVVASLANARKSYYEVLAAEKLTQAAEAELKKADLELQLGSGTSTDLTDWATKHTSRQIALSTALLNLNMAKADLEKTVGRLPVYCYEILEGVAKGE